MTHVEFIKDLYENEKKSLRTIAKQTGHSVTTVQKYAYQADWNQPEKFKPQREFPVMQEYTPTVDKWLEQDEREPLKQRHTIMRVYHRPRDECGYTGCKNIYRQNAA